MWSFEFARILSIVPAIFGTLYNVYRMFHPTPDNWESNTRRPPVSIDYFVSALWVRTIIFDSDYGYDLEYLIY